MKFEFPIGCGYVGVSMTNATRKPRGILITGNWKMNHGPEAARKFFAALPSDTAALISAKNGLRAAVYVPDVSIVSAREAAAERGLGAIRVGAQNVHWEKSGAFTGEISGPMLTELGVSTALVGHSERRQYFGETDATARKRTESLLAQGFEVILCVGETREERESGRTNEVLNRQLVAVLGEKGADATHPARPYLDGRLVIAYEPVWAIGTGLTATPEQAQEAHAFIRGLLAKVAGDQAAARTSVLYGGSVTPQNVDQLLGCADIDGALVGGASLKPESFLALLTAGAK